MSSHTLHTAAGKRNRKKTPLFKIFNENIQKHSVKWLQLIFVDLVTCK